MKEHATTFETDVNARIAARVRALRARHGLSLEALAAKSNVSRSMISLVERGETSPTAVVLEKLAAGLGTSLASLFEDSAAPASPVSRRSDRRAWRDPQTGYVRCNISPPGFASPIQLVEVTLPAGAHVAYESGPRDAAIYQQIWVQEGRVEIGVGSEVHALDADDCLAMQLNAPTSFRNRTRKTARYIVAIASESARPPRR